MISHCFSFFKIKQSESWSKSLLTPTVTCPKFYNIHDTCKNVSPLILPCFWVQFSNNLPVCLYEGRNEMCACGSKCFLQWSCQESWDTNHVTLQYVKINLRLMCVTNILNLNLHNSSNQNNFWHKSRITTTNTSHSTPPPPKSIKQVLILCGPNYTCEFLQSGPC
jgi:hypothetical protein